MAQKKEGKKGCPKIGSNKRRCSRYQDRNRFEINKLKRIIRSNGGGEAIAWIINREKKEKCSLNSILRSLRTLKPTAFRRAVEKSPAFAKAVGAK